MISSAASSSRQGQIKAEVAASDMFGAKNGAMVSSGAGAGKTKKYT